MRHWLLLFVPLLLVASCTPVPEEEEGSASCGLLEGPDCRKTVPGDPPPPDTEIGKLAKNCSRPRVCGGLAYVDCGSAVDGPAYYYERASGKVVGFCGGYCMADFEGKCAKTCPPPEWTCDP
jgi:hypothetical protein